MRRPLVIGVCLGCVACAGDDGKDPMFIEAAAEKGLHFWHFSGATGRYYVPEIAGSGVALIDFDSDGDLDVFFLQGARLDEDSGPGDVLRPPPAGWVPGNRIYRNELIPSGKMEFVDVSARAGELGSGYGMGAATADFDNDGDRDLYLTGLGNNHMLLNEAGRFRDVTSESGSNDVRWNVGASFLDFDDDGDLDLFVAAYLAEPLSHNPVCRNPTGGRDYCSPTNYRGLSDRLYRNDGDGRFTDISDTSGIADETGTGLGVVGADFNGDGRPDIYVANDRTPNRLWINQGDGQFADVAPIAGAAYNGDGLTESSMGVTAEDYDSDGDMDLFMTHLSTETNTLYRNDGKGNFFDATDRAELGSASLRYTGWGTKWIDADNDGDLDLFVVNGAIMTGVSDSDHHPYAQRNQLYLADGDRYTVIYLPGRPENSRGAAFGDLDNDGDIDVVVSNNDGPAELYLNTAAAKRHWLSLSLRGTTSNRDATGARVALLETAREPVWRRVSADGSYASANDPRVHFGLARRTAPVDVGVVWPNGSREIWRELPVDRIAELVEGEGEPWH